MSNKGPPCPQCGELSSDVKDSRFAGQRRIRRRRQCRHGHRFTTFELSLDSLATLEKELENVKKIMSRCIKDFRVKATR